MFRSVLFLILLVSVDSKSQSDDVNFMTANKRLYDALFANYAPFQSPYNTASTGRKDEPAKVFITLRYSHLTQVIEVQMTHHQVFGVELIWRDPRLTWKPADYNNISYVYVRSRDIWMPEMTACESSSFSLITSERRQKVKVNSTGHIEKFLIGHASFICEFNVQNFPFDHHWCFYCFALPSYEESELIFVGRNASSRTVLDSSEWKMNMYGSRYRTVPETNRKDPTMIYFDILLSRRPTFWIFLIIIPTFLLGFLILLGLFFGKERNNLNVSVDLGLIAFTSFTFIIGILSDSLPQSEHISILGWHIVFELLLITGAILSVSLHGALTSAANAGYAWWTGEKYAALTELPQAIRQLVHPSMTDDNGDVNEAEGIAQSGRRVNLKKRHRVLGFFLDKVHRGVFNFSLFLALHVANVAWLLAYAFGTPPEMPADYFMRADD